MEAKLIQINKLKYLIVHLKCSLKTLLIVFNGVGTFLAKYLHLIQKL
jgi:hypothetical protein